MLTFVVKSTWLPAWRHCCMHAIARFSSLLPVPQSLSCRKLVSSSKKKNSTASRQNGDNMCRKLRKRKHIKLSEADGRRSDGRRRRGTPAQPPDCFDFLGGLRQAKIMLTCADHLCFAWGKRLLFCAEPVKSSVLGKWFLPAVRISVSVICFGSPD